MKTLDVRLYQLIVNFYARKSLFCDVAVISHKRLLPSSLRLSKLKILISCVMQKFALHSMAKMVPIVCLI